MTLLTRLLFLLLLIAPSIAFSQSSRYEFAGNVTAFQPIEGGVDITLGKGKVRIEYVQGVGYRVRHTRETVFPEIFSYALADNNLSTARVDVRDETTLLTLTANEDVLVVQKNPFRLTFQDRSGSVWFKESFGSGFQGGKIVHVLARPETEHYFGLGEKATEFNRTGKTFTQWNTDVPSYKFNDDPLNKTFPFYYGVRDGKTWGIFYDNSWRSEIDLGGQLKTHLGYYADGGELRFYLFSGPTMAKVIEKYTKLTGRSTLPPLWALGFQVISDGTVTEPDVYNIANAYRSRNVPLDAIHLNRSSTANFQVFTWDGLRFPNAQAMVDEMGKRGINIVQTIDPGIKDDAFFDIRNEGVTQSAYLKYPDGSFYVGDTWAGSSLFPDFSNPTARTWWGTLFQRSLNEGISGYSLSMNEPTTFGGNALPDLVEYQFEGKGAGHIEMHNVYGMLMAKAAYEGLNRLRPASRPFITTRAAYSGVQRYASVWTGDNSARWDDVYLGLPMVMGLGMAGVPGAGFIIGGVTGSPDAEMYTRSLQLGSLMPLAQSVTSIESDASDPWVFGERYERINREFIRMRYRLMPAIYTAYWQHTKTGSPVIRPLLWNWPTDHNVLQIDDQFMLGDHVMVAPVLKQGVNERSVYLPEGLWYKFHSREKIQGGRRIIESAPSQPTFSSSTDDSPALRSMPMYARAGAIVAEQEYMDYAGQKPVKEMLLQIFAGGNQTSYLYEDDGSSTDYRQSQFRALTFTTEAYPGGFKIKATQEGNYADAAIRFSYMIHGLDRKPDRITVNGRNIVYFYEPRTNTIVFKISAGATDIHVVYQ